MVTVYELIWLSFFRQVLLHTLFIVLMHDFWCMAFDWFLIVVSSYNTSTTQTICYSRQTRKMWSLLTLGLQEKKLWLRWWQLKQGRTDGWLLRLCSLNSCLLLWLKHQFILHCTWKINCLVVYYYSIIVMKLWWSVILAEQEVSWLLWDAREPFWAIFKLDNFSDLKNVFLKEG